MANIGLRFDILARNRASGPLNEVGDSARRAGGHLAGIGKAAAIGLGGAAIGAIAGFGAALKGGFEEAISYQKITDQLAQTIKSTGGAAGVSVDQLKAYAGQLESLSGVDEELILSSQNVLATFTQIQNSAGKGNDIFNQASLAALNLSTTLGTDVASAAVQVGKALNDPTKGITALSKAGVSFTAQQKEQIKTLQKSGDTLGAQKIILKELNKEFGGAAAAAGKGLGGSIARLKDTFSDTFRDIATRALPTITKLADGLAKVLPGAIDKTFTFLGKLGAAIGVVVKAFKSGDDAGGAQASTLERVGAVLRTVSDFVRTRVVPAFLTISRVFYTQVVPAVVAFEVAFIRRVGPGLVKVGQFIAQQVVPVLKSLWSAIQTQIVPAFQGLYARIMDNKELFITIGKVIGTFAAVVLVVAARLAKVLIPVLATLIRFAFAVIGKIIGIVAAFSRFITKVGETAAAVGRFVANAVQFITSFQGKVVAALAGLGGAILRIIRSAFSNLKTGASEKVAELIAFLLSVPGQVLSAIGDLGSVLYEKGKELIGGLLSGIKDAAKSIPGAIKDAVTFDIPGIDLPKPGNPFNLRGAGGPAPVSAGPSKQFSFGGSRAIEGADMRETNVLLRVLLNKIDEQTTTIQGVGPHAQAKGRTRMAGVYV